MTDPDTYDSLKPAWMNGGEDDEDEDDEMGWQEAYAIRLGWEPLPFPEDYPEIDYREPYEQRRAKEDVFRQTPMYQAYDAREEEKDILTKDVPFELNTYGYCDEPRYRSCGQRTAVYGGGESRAPRLACSAVRCTAVAH
jgi:hypothetical protein